MPYGCLDSEKLSQVSRIGLDKALDWWQKSMLTSKHRTYLVIGGYDSDAGQEIKLRREIVNQTLQDQELLNNIFEVSASN